MSPCFDLLLIKPILFLGAKASFAPTITMTKLHWDTFTGSKYHMPLSQTLSRKVSMSLWLKEERKESSSSSEKQICLPPLRSCLFSERLFLLFSATAGLTSNRSLTWRLGKEAGQEGGEVGNNEAKGQPVFPFGDSSSWGKDAAPSPAGSPSQRALILRKRRVEVEKKHVFSFLLSTCAVVWGRLCRDCHSYDKTLSHTSFSLSTTWLHTLNRQILP